MTHLRHAQHSTYPRLLWKTGFCGKKKWTGLSHTKIYLLFLYVVNERKKNRKDKKLKKSVSWSCKTELCVDARSIRLVLEAACQVCLKLPAKKKKNACSDVVREAAAAVSG